MTDSASPRTESLNRYSWAGLRAVVSIRWVSRLPLRDLPPEVPFLASGSKHHGPVEGQARFRAIPLDEFVDGVVVCALAAFGGESVENSRFRVFKVRSGRASVW